MFRAVLGLSLICVSCGSVEQPDSIRTVAAYEVPLPTAADKARFVDLLKTVAAAEGFHVDVANPEDLSAESAVSPISFKAGVWRGKNDNELIASAMDFQDHIGRVWITFSRGEAPIRSARFREAILPLIRREWPGTASLPIMPSGVIPLASDLVRTPDGYELKPTEASKYAGQQS